MIHLTYSLCLEAMLIFVDVLNSTNIKILFWQIIWYCVIFFFSHKLGFWKIWYIKNGQVVCLLNEKQKGHLSLLCYFLLKYIFIPSFIQFFFHIINIIFTYILYKKKYTFPQLSVICIYIIVYFLCFIFVIPTFLNVISKRGSW